MRTLIVGATGTIGKEIYKQCKENGHEVVATSRKSVPSMNIEEPLSVSALFDKNGNFDAIICSAGNASFGSLKDLDSDQINVGVKSKLLGQVDLVKKGVDKLNAGGVMIITGGILAHAPWPQTSNIAMVNAGLEGFTRAVSLELEDEKRVLIVHPPLVRETAEMMGMDTSPWPTAGLVAKTYVDCIDKKESGVPVYVEGYVPQTKESVA